MADDHGSGSALESTNNASSLIITGQHSLEASNETESLQEFLRASTQANNYNAIRPGGEGSSSHSSLMQRPTSRRQGSFTASTEHSDNSSSYAAERYDAPNALSRENRHSLPVPRPVPSTQTSDESVRPLASRGVEYVLPKWQPDEDVTNCPICGVTFTFFTRKHHCRKCGSVVCNSCSPHRITIPVQYVVHPEPVQVQDDPTPVIDLTGDDDIQVVAERTVRRDRSTSQPIHPTLGGGQEVRICNPCVPDPNNAPPHYSANSQTNYSMPRGRHLGPSRVSYGDQTSTIGPAPPDYQQAQFFQLSHQPHTGDMSTPRHHAPGHGRAMSAQERYMGLGPSGVLPIEQTAWNPYNPDGSRREVSE